ncbi:YraN family protein [Patescibacteria group bacterium]|nr:YraN family protein [Patescibacteria group bacterium]
MAKDDTIKETIMDTKILGKFGEDLACSYLKRNNYKILERNYIKTWDDKTKGEIDVIIRKDGIVCFVEVKTQEASEGFYPEDKVDYKKQRKLMKLAQSWLIRNKVPLDSAWQIDIVSILLNRETKKAKISHFKNIVETS